MVVFLEGPRGQELGDRASGGRNDASLVCLSHRLSTCSPCFLFCGKRAFGDSGPLAGGRVFLRATKFEVPLRTTLVYSAFHEAASSRSPAVTISTRPPSR